MSFDSTAPNLKRSFVKAKLYDMTLLHEGVFRQNENIFYLSFDAISKAAAEYTGRDGLAPIYLKYCTPSGNHDFLEAEEAKKILVGYVERLYVNGDGWLTARVLINTSEAIDLIDKKGWKQSIGYVIAGEEPMDKADGIDVVGKITSIGFDHILITDKPKYKGVTVVTCDEDDSGTNQNEEKAMTEEEKKAAAAVANNEEKPPVTNTEEKPDEKKKVEDSEDNGEEKTGEVANEDKPKEIGADEEHDCVLPDGRKVALSELRTCYAEHNPKPDEILINGKAVTNSEIEEYLKSKKITNSEAGDTSAEKKLQGFENKMLAQSKNTTTNGLTPFTA